MRQYSIVEEINICRLDYVNVPLNRTTLTTLGSQFNEIINNNSRWCVINPHHRFHLTYDHARCWNGHLTCWTGNGISHISLARSRPEIEAWYNECCSQISIREDWFFNVVIEKLPNIRL